MSFNALLNLRFVQEINDTLDVEGLCRGLPKRLQELLDADGDRINH